VQRNGSFESHKSVNLRTVLTLNCRPVNLFTASIVLSFGFFPVLRSRWKFGRIEFASS